MENTVMKLGIYTIEKTLFEGDVKEIVVKTVTGELTVLDNHAPFVTRTIKAPLSIINDKGEKKFFDIGEGFLEVEPQSRVVVLIDAQ